MIPSKLTDNIIDETKILLKFSFLRKEWRQYLLNISELRNFMIYFTIDYYM